MGLPCPNLGFNGQQRKTPHRTADRSKLKGACVHRRLHPSGFVDTELDRSPRARTTGAELEGEPACVFSTCLLTTSRRDKQARGRRSSWVRQKCIPLNGFGYEE